MYIWIVLTVFCWLEEARAYTTWGAYNTLWLCVMNVGWEKIQLYSGKMIHSSSQPFMYTDNNIEIYETSGQNEQIRTPIQCKSTINK